MKLQVKTSSTTIIEAEGKTEVELFKQVASLQEVFSEKRCGKCEKNNLKYVVREDSDQNEYFELLCLSCWAKLTYGQNKGEKVGQLYPRRFENKKQTVMGGQLEAGTKLPNNGWIKWNKEKQCNE